MTEHIYTITVPKSINRESCLNVMAVQNTTRSTFDWEYSGAVQLSTPPMTGQYFIECYDTSGNPYYTEDLSVGSDIGTISSALIAACPWLRDSFSIWHGSKYSHNVDGLDWKLFFSRVKGPLNQYKVYPSFTNPLVGTNITYEFKTTATYGPNVYYDVLPFEQIYTADTAPAIRVKVDGKPVLCKSTHCSYAYEESTALITGFTVTGQDIQITGVDLPVDITKVVFSN